MLIQYDQANDQANVQANVQANDQANVQANEQQNEHIITILNYTYNYFNNKEDKEKFFDKISKSQKEGIILILKRLKIYLGDSAENLEAIPQNLILETKIKYYAIKELYFSPYAANLKNLSEEMLNIRFQKTKKYINITEDIYHFVSYFIKSLQTQLS